jgi:sugar phosphate isomerase/epimerase
MSGFLLLRKESVEGHPMRFGICAPLRQVAQLKEFPFDYLEEGVQRFLVPEQPHQEFVALWHEAQHLPVPVEAANALLPADLVLVATSTQPVDASRLERYIKTTLQRAEQAEVRILVFGSGNARMCPPGHDHADALRQISDHFALWVSWATQYHVQFVLEPLRYQETNTLNTVAESGEWLSHVPHAGASLLADFYHMLANQEAPETLPPWVPLLSHVHLAELEGRTAPGYHGEDFRPYLRALREGGYDQRISIECNWHDFAAEVGPALATLRQQWLESV